MRVAANISFQKRLCTASEVVKLNDLLSCIGLPERIQKIRRENILRHMQHDKKFLSGKNRFVLMVQIGKVKILEGISSAVLTKAIEAYQ
jgi:3-dehydroquinate synthetase